uniref:Uncharacterized protein n=1 Tax=Rhizophora mucronata TaxID=61149 RepID=A0A2P2QCW4_RHIMU
MEIFSNLQTQMRLLLHLILLPAVLNVILMSPRNLYASIMLISSYMVLIVTLCNMSLSKLTS